MVTTASVLSDGASRLPACVHRWVSSLTASRATFRYENPAPKPTLAGCRRPVAWRTASMRARTVAPTSCVGRTAGPGGGGPAGIALCECVADMRICSAGTENSVAICADACWKTSSPRPLRSAPMSTARVTPLSSTIALTNRRSWAYFPDGGWAAFTGGVTSTRAAPARSAPCSTAAVDAGAHSSPAPRTIVTSRMPRVVMGASHECAPGRRDVSRPLDRTVSLQQ